MTNRLSGSHGGQASHPTNIGWMSELTVCLSGVFVRCKVDNRRFVYWGRWKVPGFMVSTLGSVVPTGQAKDIKRCSQAGDLKVSRKAGKTQRGSGRWLQRGVGPESHSLLLNLQIINAYKIQEPAPTAAEIIQVTMESLPKNLLGMAALTSVTMTAMNNGNNSIIVNPLSSR